MKTLPVSKIMLLWEPQIPQEYVAPNSKIIIE
jgi:hypothetical protein